MNLYKNYSPRDQGFKLVLHLGIAIKWNVLVSLSFYILHLQLEIKKKIEQEN